MTVRSFEDLFISELSDIYSAEKQLVRALPKMAKAASNDELKEIFTNHRLETEEQVTRIEQAVKKEGLALKRKKCAAMEGLVEEGSEAISSIEEGPLLDVSLIVCGQ